MLSAGRSLIFLALLWPLCLCRSLARPGWRVCKSHVVRWARRGGNVLHCGRLVLEQVAVRRPKQGSRTSADGVAAVPSLSRSPPPAPRRGAPSEAKAEKVAAQVRRFHDRTKHSATRSAPKLGGEPIWAHQPSPFRLFNLTHRVALPVDAHAAGVIGDAPAAALFETALLRTAPAVSVDSISALLRLALAISATRVAPNGRSRWTLRTNPSSGALQPVEGYLFLPPGCGRTALPSEPYGRDGGIFHYAAYDHTLEYRSAWPWPRGDADDEEAGQSGCAGFGIALTFVVVRQTFKYGERGFRYCLLDVGHAMATLGAAAAALGWRARRAAVEHDVLMPLLGLEATAWRHLEDEEPAMLFGIGDLKWLPSDVSGVRAGSLALAEHPGPMGTPVPLWGQGVTQHAYPEVDRVRRRTRLSSAAAEVADVAPGEGLGRDVAALPGQPQLLPPTALARDLITSRRSAREMDPRGRALSRAEFDFLLRGLLPGSSPLLVAAAAAGGQNQAAAAGVAGVALFVHRVEGLAPGLYLLERDGRLAADLLGGAPRAAARGLPRHLHLLLAGGAEEVQAAARSTACGQSIASDGFLSAAMIGDLGARAAEYREAHFVAGALGQHLYLAAEALGAARGEPIRGTGIGCFLDDALHSMLGLGQKRSRRGQWQVVYMFALGKESPDDRTSIDHPYSHLPAPAARSSAAGR